ncbi:MAG: pyridoxal phosphate biosynthetic protein [Erythrobacter sp.]
MPSSAPEFALTGKQKLWALAAAIPFLLSLAFLGYALNTRAVMVLAVAWPALQILGYVGAINRAKGDFAHPLWISQVMIHWIALALIGATLGKAA